MHAANATQFDEKRGKRIGEIARVADAFKEWDAAKTALAELERRKFTAEEGVSGLFDLFRLALQKLIGVLRTIRRTI